MGSKMSENPGNPFYSAPEASSSRQTPKVRFYLPSTPSLSFRAQTSSDHVPQTHQRAQGTRKTVSCRKNIINLHMDKRSSSRWLLVSVQRAATLIKRNDSFIHDTKKSNVIADISRCYSFNSGQRGKFPFHKRIAAILIKTP